MSVTPEDYRRALAERVVLAAFAGQGFVTVEQASLFLCLGESTIRHWISAGVLKTVKLGGKRMFTVQALVDYLVNAGAADYELEQAMEPPPTPPAKRGRGRPRKIAAPQ